MKDLIATSVAQNRNMATDRAQGQNLGIRPKLGHYVRLQGGDKLLSWSSRKCFFQPQNIPFSDGLKSVIEVSISEVFVVY